MENKYLKALEINQENYFCTKCKSTKVNLIERQTRGSDEPLTILLFCKNCKFVENITN